MQGYICGSSKEELRPYGHGGQPICFPCMIGSPEREAEAKKNFGALLQAAETMGQPGASGQSRHGHGNVEAIPLGLHALAGILLPYTILLDCAKCRIK